MSVFDTAAARPAFWHDAKCGIEGRYSTQNHACYRLHSHETHSFGCVDDGITLLSLADGLPVPLQAGDVLWIPHTLAHCCNPPPQQHWAYQMLYLAPNACAELPPFGNRLTVWRSPSLYRQFQHVHHFLRHDAGSHVKQTALQTLLQTAHAAADGIYWQQLPPTHEHARQRLQQLLQHPDFMRMSVAQMAHCVGVSRYHFMRLFRQTTGWSAHAYQTNRRILAAKPRLRRGDAIAQVALDLGFADQSHFQRCFKQLTAATPKQYR